MRCPKCGAPLPDDAKVCSICGEKIMNGTAGEPAKVSARPRDENFDVESPVRRKTAEELRVKPERRDQSVAVITGILLTAVLIAVAGILIYYAFKAHQRTVVGVVTATTPAEDFLNTTETAATTQESVTIDEKTKATGEESEETTEEESSEAAEETVVVSGEEAESSFVEETTEDPGVDREYGGVVYHIVNGEATLLRCYSTDAIMWMPSSVFDARCVAIADGAFADCSHLRAIELPSGYVTIGSGAFSNCVNLETAVIPDTVTNIGDSAFAGDPAAVIRSSAGSYAKNYADTAGVSWEEGNALGMN